MDGIIKGIKQLPGGMWGGTALRTVALGQESSVLYQIELLPSKASDCLLEI